MMSSYSFFSSSLSSPSLTSSSMLVDASIKFFTAQGSLHSGHPGGGFLSSHVEMQPRQNTC